MLTCLRPHRDRYAEWFGDRKDLSLAKEQQQLLDRVTERGVPVVAIVLAGRPLVARDSWKSVDALLLAFLPGSEGGLGIVDLLLGVAKPTATMPLGLPEKMEADEAAQELFALGQGLTYEDMEEGGAPPQPFLRREFT